MIVLHNAKKVEPVHVEISVHHTFSSVDKTPSKIEVPGAQHRACEKGPYQKEIMVVHNYAKLCVVIHLVSLQLGIIRIEILICSEHTVHLISPGLVTNYT